MKDSNREAFEAYMAEKYKNLVDRRRCLNNGGGYMAWDMNVAWQVWQAAKAQAVPEGFVVVPMEPTEQILNRMTNTPIEVNHLCDNADIFLSEDEARIAYKAMIALPTGCIYNNAERQAKDIKACESVGARWQYSSLTKQVNCVPNRQKWGNQE